MSQPLYPPERNYRLLKELKRSITKYFNDDRAELKIYSGVFHGLNEVIRAIGQTFPHRQEMIYFKGLSPYIPPLVRLASKEGMNLKGVPKKEMENALDLVEELSADTLFALIAEDDPLTGERFNISGMIEALGKKRIFSICISHRVRLIEKSLNPPSPFSATFIPIENAITIGVLGARTKVDDLIYGGIPLGGDLVEKTEHALFDSTEDEEKVKEFESKFSEVSFFHGETPRIFDRAVLKFENIDASAIATFMSRDFSHTDLTSGSLCEWNDEKYLSWLTESGLTPEEIRGLLVIPHNKITKKFESDLKATIDKVLKLQNG